MGVAALVLGIVAIVFSLLGLGVPVGVICGLVGVILGALAKKSNPGSGLATGGLVCSIIGTVLSVIAYIACAACIASLPAMF